MLHSLNAGFGEPIGRGFLSTLSVLGVEGIRQDIKSLATLAASNDRAVQLVQEFSGQTFLQSLFLVEWAQYTAELAQTVVRNVSGMMTSAVQIGNELNLTSVTPEAYARAFNEIEDACQGINPNVPLVTAGVSCLDARGLAWFEEVAKRVSLSAVLGFHGYRHAKHPEPSWSYLESREEEFSRLRKAANGRRIWNTEVGFHTAPRRTGWWIFGRTFSLSDAQALDYLQQEAALNEQAGIEVMVVYQLNDGPNPKNDKDRYGIRTTAGVWKPQSTFFKRAE